MAAEFISLEPGSVNKPQIDRAAKALADGALVAFPTETVYGLGVNAANAAGVERLRIVKGRAAARPFTVHIGRRHDCDAFVPSISSVARRFIRKGWPGPLTLVFPVPDPALAAIHPRLSEPGSASIYAQGSVGIRLPDHAGAADLLAAAAAPIIASSANHAGEPAPTDARTVRERLGDEIDLILDGGATKYQRGSTIVALNGEGYRVLRSGVWDERTVRQLGSLTILFVCSGNTCRSPMAEGIARRMISEKLGCKEEELGARGIVVRSAGTMAYSGGRASAEAVDVCRRRGIDISPHTSHPLTLELIRPADYIFAMGRHHLDVLRSIAPADAAKASALDPTGDIADPVGGTIEDYERAAARITDSLRKRLEEVPL